MFSLRRDDGLQARGSPVPTSSASKGEAIRERIRANRDKRLQIAEAMKQEAGVVAHEFNERREDLSGLAFIGTGRIKSPEGQNIHELYTVAHECGHIFLHNESPGMWLPSHVKELEAESYAQQAFVEHGMRVPRWLTDGGRRYVGSWVEKDRAAGVAIDPRAVAYAHGTRSPYEPLRMVPSTWTRHAASQNPLSRIDSLRRSSARWMRTQPGSMRWTILDIWSYVSRGLAFGMFVTMISIQLRAGNEPLEPIPFFFTVFTGGLVGACLCMLQRPIIRRTPSRRGV